MAPVSLLCVYLGGVYFFALVAMVFCFSVYEWTRMAMRLKRRALMIVLGLAYFIPCFALFASIRADENGLPLIVLLFILVWASDIGAYFAGKYLGKTKCAPKISPNKTWAGVWGGVITAIICANLYVFYVLPDLFDVYHICIMAVVISFASMLGDLLISFIKRLAQVKDTGTIIPGHGGVLDRVDSLILAAPAMAYFVFWGFV
tara:strand:- start:547628 stop:548236 length:609 start_codon:yes stop_codon:yes gene_type:complete